MNLGSPLTFSQRMGAKNAAGDRLQNRVNEIHKECHTTKELRLLREHLVSIADAHLAEFPQYAGRYDNYGMGVMKSQLKTKGGLHALAGDVVLFTSEGINGPWIIFSNRTFHEVSTGSTDALVPC